MNSIVNTFVGRIALPTALMGSLLGAVSPCSAQIMTKSGASVASGSDRLLRANSTTEIGSNTVLQIDGTLRVAGNSQATLKLDSQSLVRGAGSLKVEAGATLIIDANQGQLGKVTVDNQGTVVLKGTVDCENGLDFQTSGKLILDTDTPADNGDFQAFKANVKSMYPGTGALFTIRNAGVLSGHGVLDGSVVVESGGKIVLSAGGVNSNSAIKLGQVVRDSSGRTVVRRASTPSPSPDFVTITGDVTMSSGSLDIDFTSTSYGQLAVSGSVVLGNSTLNCYLLNGYTPAYVDAFRIIKADNVTGQFGTFNATALNFDNRGIITITGGKAYRLSGY